VFYAEKKIKTKKTRPGEKKRFKKRSSSSSMERKMWLSKKIWRKDGRGRSPTELLQKWNEVIAQE
jgi:hypothetical protein